MDFFCQSLSKFADILLGLAVYIYMTGSVCIYCWLGNELSIEVSMTDYMKFSFILMF